MTIPLNLRTRNRSYYSSKYTTGEGGDRSEGIHGGSLFGPKNTVPSSVSSVRSLALLLSKYTLQLFSLLSSFTGFHFLGACLRVRAFVCVYMSRLFTRRMAALLSSPSRIPGNGSLLFYSRSVSAHDRPPGWHRTARAALQASLEWGLNGREHE